MTVDDVDVQEPARRSFLFVVKKNYFLTREWALIAHLGDDFRDRSPDVVFLRLRALNDTKVDFRRERANRRAARKRRRRKTSCYMSTHVEGRRCRWFAHVGAGSSERGLSRDRPPAAVDREAASGARCRRSALAARS